MKWVLIVILHTSNMAQGPIQTMQIDFTSVDHCRAAQKEVVAYISKVQTEAEALLGTTGAAGGTITSVNFLRGRAFCVER